MTNSANLSVKPDQAHYQTDGQERVSADGADCETAA
jgi:hypothetical protein